MGRVGSPEHPGLASGLPKPGGEISRSRNGGKAASQPPPSVESYGRTRTHFVVFPGTHAMVGSKSIWLLHGVWITLQWAGPGCRRNSPIPRPPPTSRKLFPSSSPSSFSRSASSFPPPPPPPHLSPSSSLLLYRNDLKTILLFLPPKRPQTKTSAEVVWQE